MDFIPSQCWCGERRSVIYKRGQWYAESVGTVSYTLGRCIKCSTIRTIESSRDKINYDESVIYNEELGPRQLSSIATINKYLTGESILDIGCSAGAVLFNLLKLQPQLKVVRGIDLNEKAIANKLSESLFLEYKDVSEVNDQFDNIIALHTIEHIPDLKSFFSNFKKLGKLGTICYLSVPNILSFNARFALNTWGALNPTQHSWHFSKLTLRKMLFFYLDRIEILDEKNSWIFVPNRLRKVCNYMPFGDQVEIIFKIR